MARDNSWPLSGSHARGASASAAGDDPEDVLAARLDRVAGRPSRHEQDAVLAGGTPHPNLLGRHRARLPRKNVQDDRIGRRLRSSRCRSHRTSSSRAPSAPPPSTATPSAPRSSSRIPTPDGRLMSVQLRIGDGLLHLADEFPEMGVLAPPSIGGTAVVLALEVADAEAVFAQAVAAGAEVRSRCRTCSGAIATGSSTTPSGIAGTSASTCATCRTTRSWPPPRRPSPELRPPARPAPGCASPGARSRRRRSDACRFAVANRVQ